MTSRVIRSGFIPVIGRPSKRIVPRCGRYTPEMQLKTEVLPAPFGPMMAWMFPFSTPTETSLTAFTPPKARLMSSSRSSVMFAP
jgi:hypothetical protein